MNNLKLLLLIVLLALIPRQTKAEIFVNDRAPGVKQSVEQGTGEKIWVNSLGQKIANVKDSKTLADLDKDDYAYETDKIQQGRVVINPKLNGITKKWDNYRKCYIWMSKTGDYLGRVPSELQQKEWEKSQKQDWLNDIKLTQAARDWQNGVSTTSTNPDASPLGNIFGGEKAIATDNDNIDCSKELNEILNDKHMTVSLAKERLGQGGLTAKQQKALEKYISMGGKASPNNKNVDAEIAKAEAELKKIAEARAELKALGGYDEFAAEIEAYEAELKAKIKKYKSQK